MSSAPGSWPPGVSGHLKFESPQFFLSHCDSPSGEVTVQLTREVATPCGIIIRVYKSSEPLLEKPEQAPHAESQFLVAKTVSVTFTAVPAEKYVVLCCMADKGKSTSPTQLHLETSHGQLVNTDVESARLSHKLTWRGAGAAGYGDDRNPQFFLRVHQKTRARITMFATYGSDETKNELAHQFVIYKAKKPNRRSLKNLEENLVAKSSLKSSHRVSAVLELAPGPYIVVCHQSEKGHPGSCALDVLLATIQHPAVELSGEEFSRAPSFTPKAFNELIDAKKLPPTMKLGSAPLDGFFDLEEGKLLVDEINKQIEEQCATDNGKGCCFKDHAFGHTTSSLNKIEDHPSALSPVDWTRPATIFDEPVLFAAKASTGDVHQGSLQNCWFCSALAAIASRHERVSHLFYPQKYNPNGVYLVKLFIDKQWRGVIIDDYLPTRNESLVFVKSNQENELWLSLLEKAASKLAGSYQSLGYNCPFSTEDVFAAFTGGQPGEVKVDDVSKEDFWAILKEYTEKNWILTTSTKRVGECDTVRNGIVSDHAYTVLGVVGCEGFRLVHLMNTWGRTEWHGKWSDGHAIWKQHPAVAKACGQDPNEKIDDGCFWMELKDFCDNYKILHTCRFSGDEYPQCVVHEEADVPAASIMRSTHTATMPFFQLALRADRARANMLIKMTLTRQGDDEGKKPLSTLVVHSAPGGLFPVGVDDREPLANDKYTHDVSTVALEMPAEEKEFALIPSLAGEANNSTALFTIRVEARSKVAKCTLEVAKPQIFEQDFTIAAQYKKKALVLKIDVPTPQRVAAKVRFEGTKQGVLGAIATQAPAPDMNNWPVSTLTESKYVKIDEIAIEAKVDKAGPVYLWLCQGKAVHRQVHVSIHTQAPVAVEQIVGK